jgi:hypothetical protein
MRVAPLQLGDVVFGRSLVTLPAGDIPRAAAFVVPSVRDAFAAGLGAWAKNLLEMIVFALRKTESFTCDSQAALQWWIFVNSNFPVIFKDFNAFVAVARQWDVHGIVYESLFGRIKESSSTAVGKMSLAAVATAAASATAKPFGGGASSTYLQYPFRHSFPTVSYQQRSRHTSTREISRLPTFRCGHRVSVTCFC